MTKKILLLFILSIVILYGNSKEKVTLQLDWLNQFQFAGYYIAKEKGFYSKNNLDVEIKEHLSNIDIVKEALEKEAYYAIGKSSLVLDRLEGKNIILLSAIFQNSPLVLITTKKSGIKKIQDLKNKKIMITNDANASASISAMIISSGLTQEDILIQAHSFNIEDLINGNTDAMACYLSNEPFILKNRKIEFNILNPKDYNFDFYSGILFTSQNELRKHPNRVENFKKASLEGWKYAFENIEETAKIIYDNYNTQNKSLKSLIYEGKILKNIAKFDENILGDIKINKINEIQRIYSLLGYKDSKDKYIVDDLIYNAKNIYLNEEEILYLQNNSLSFFTNSNVRPLTMKIDNKLTGIEIEYIKLINKLLDKNIKIKIRENNDTVLKSLDTDKNSFKYLFSQADLQTNKYINTNPVAELKIAIATLIDKPFIEDIKQLNNKKIALNKDSIYLEKFKKLYPKIKFIETKSIDESFKLLSKNEVFAVISKLPLLSYFINNKELTNIKISGTLPDTFEMKLLLNKDNKILRDILNKAIAQITQEDRFKINSKFNLVKYETHIDYSWIYKITLPLVLIIILILIANKKLSNEIKKRKIAEQKLYELANKDDLTKIYNRRRIDEIYRKEFNRVERYNSNFSIIFFDIDDFKDINDFFSHKTGDDILIKIANTINENIRNTDYFGRWGGDEFLVVLPQTTKKEASIVVKTLIEKIKKLDYEIKDFPIITCSFGISEYKKGDSINSLLTRADNKMYEMKNKKKEKKA